MSKLYINEKGKLIYLFIDKEYEIIIFNPNHSRKKYLTTIITNILFSNESISYGCIPIK